jgi:hypothetical protein
VLLVPDHDRSVDLGHDDKADAWRMRAVRGRVEGSVSPKESRMTPILQVKAEFERIWAQAYKAYRPLIRPDDGDNLIHMTSAIKGLAWNCYLQGRTDEMARELSASKASALIRSRAKVPRA